ncbi:hypothetical protein L4D20_14405 [Vibrio kyushuensis]
MILQIIIATVVAGLATGRYWWGKFLNLINVRKTDDEQKVKKDGDKD